MGGSFDAAKALDAEVVMQTYARKPVMFVRGEGMRLYDDEGREYLDFVSGIGAVNLGHAHPAVTAALCDQASKLVHVSNLFYVEHRAELASDIVGLLGGGWRVFFSNSGAEAVEGAIKLARRWAGVRKPGAFKVVSLDRSFHGRTLAALAATGQASKQEAFAPMPEGFVHVPANDLVALAAAVDDTVAAVMLEVVQGEGGVWPLSDEYLRGARSICDAHGCLLVIDEIQTGFFRTGPAFAHQASGVVPDVITVAKALANGLPIGGIVARDEVAATLAPGDHGSTFGGGPAICAAGRATVGALIAEKLGDNATQSGAYLRERLQSIADATRAITDVRGAGLMVGLTLRNPIAQQVGATALERGIVINAIGTDILRFLPPLVCGKAEIDTLCCTLSDILGESSEADAHS
ncbi:MAG: acetylornithine/succinylornithine family transaminase [Coriobacteriia bacterium]|nr:acetylornithine/succinylornithine family transaminase [Coriobacteriia bacterium]